MRSLARISNVVARAAWLKRHRSKFQRASDGALPRLLVDVSTIIRHDAQTGIQRVVRAVWSELRRRDGTEFELVPIFATSGRGYCYAPLDFPTSGSAAAAEPVGVRPGDHFLGLDLSAQFLPFYKQQLRAWQQNEATLHVLVYDLLPLIRPAFFNKRTVARFHGWFEFVAKEADHAICISRQVGRDLRERLRMAGESRGPAVSYITLGGDIAASRPTTGVCDDLSQLLSRMRFRPTILLVGTVEPRKGYGVALAAFEQLWRTRGAEAPDMVIAGRPGWKTEALRTRIRSHPEHGRRLHWLDGVSDEGLCKLYEGCRGLLMTSQAEGFGLPLLEAATHRRYVLARDLPVFREQELPNVTFFEDDRPEALAAAIMELVALAREAPAPSAQLPTWSDCVDKLLIEIGLKATIGNRSASLLRKIS